MGLVSGRESVTDMETNHIKDYWAKNHKASDGFSFAGEKHVSCPVVRCADGFTMSVQASYAHYCSPRTYVNDGDYYEWEIGFPSAKEDLIMKWVEDGNDPTGTVYGYVPTEIINQVIEKHGGIAESEAA